MKTVNTTTTRKNAKVYRTVEQAISKKHGEVSFVKYLTPGQVRKMVGAENALLKADTITRNLKKNRIAFVTDTVTMYA